MPNSSPSSPSPRSAKRRKVDPSLQYRWGIIGVALAIGFFAWYLFTSGESRSPNKTELTKPQEKIVCPRCLNDPEKKLKCSLCGGLGHIWVNVEDPPPATRAPQPR